MNNGLTTAIEGFVTVALLLFAGMIGAPCLLVGSVILFGWSDSSQSTYQDFLCSLAYLIPAVVIFLSNVAWFFRIWRRSRSETDIRVLRLFDE